MAGSVEYWLEKIERQLDRMADAQERIADSVEVRVNGRVITNMPQGSFETGYITAGGQELPDEVGVYGTNGKLRYRYRKTK
jgi:hypothetical protein